MSPSRYLTVPQAERETGLTNSYIIRMIHEGRIKAKRDGIVWLSKAMWSSDRKHVLESEARNQPL